MFIVKTIKKDEATGKLALLYTKIEETLGFIPPHFELFGTIDADGLKDFISYNLYFTKHEKIDYKLLPFMRLYIATLEKRNYCIKFNSSLLLNMNIDNKIISNILEEFDNIKIHSNQKVLFFKVIKALYDNTNFDRNDLNKLYELDFSDKDFFDLLKYASVFLSNSKMIQAYLK